MQCNFSLFHRKSCCDSLMRESESMVYAKMGVWERMPLRSHSLSIPFSSFTRMGWRRRSRCPYCVQYAALWRRMTVERHYTRLPERLGAGKSKTRAACHGGGAKKAVAAMTCPGAIPLKTAGSSTGVTIKREAHICRSSPHEAGGGTTSARAGEGKKTAPGGAAMQ